LKKLLFILILLFILNLSCSSKRPCGDVCNKSGDTLNSTSNENQILEEAFIKHIKYKIQTKRLTDEPVKENVISLSAGGQFGAYGAGFIIGWEKISSQNLAAMPNFDVVTAVSTGALLAPFLFLLSGESEYKPELINILKKIYGNGLNDSMVVSGGIINNLLNKKALYNRSPLRELLNREIRDEHLDEIGKQYEKRFLLVGTASLDTGKFRIIDLTWVASKYKGEKRKKIFIDTIMASSAIPLIFPPVFIDGEMFIDGGAREHVIFEKLDDLIKQALLNKMNLFDTGEPEEINKTFYILVHGDLAVKKQCTPFGVKDIGTRSMTIALDHLLLSSVFFNAYLAKSFVIQENLVEGQYVLVSDKEKRWNIKVKDVRNHGCTFDNSDNKIFNPKFTKCLYDKSLGEGEALKKVWITELDKIKDLLNENRVFLYPTGNHYEKCETN